MEFSLTLIIIVVTVLISIKGFSDDMFRAKAMFYPYEIKEQKEWYRFLTSGFLHADWLHLIVNMYVLYMFGPILEKAYIELTGEAGRIIYLLMYLTAIAMANVSTYFKHKDYRGYAALGASGAVSAVVFAGILIWPDMELMLLFLPVVASTRLAHYLSHEMLLSLGCVAGAAPWVAITLTIVGADTVPGFVFGIFVSLFLFFNSFALNQWLQYKQVGPWRSYAFGEKAYLVLSLVAKSALAWQIFAGSLAA